MLKVLFRWNFVGRCYLKQVELYLLWIQGYVWGKLVIVILICCSCCCKLSALLFPAIFFFVCFVRTGYSSNDIWRISDISSSHWICQKHSYWGVQFTVFNISRIAFRVIVKEVLLKVFPQIQRKQWWQKLNIFNSYGHFACLSPYCLAHSQKMRAFHTRWHNLC